MHSLLLLLCAVEMKAKGEHILEVLQSDCEAACEPLVHLLISPTAAVTKRWDLVRVGDLNSTAVPKDPQM